jgi:hypothetical protein
MLIKKNDTIINKCDSCYLINNIRYKLYEKSIKLVKSIDYSNNIYLLINNYNNEITLYKNWNDSLQKKYNSIYELYNNTLSITQNELLSIKQNITIATDSLISAKNNINNSILHLNLSNKDKYKFLGIGFISGILTTSLLILTYK